MLIAVGVVLLLVLIAPLVLSLGFLRSQVESQLTTNLNGKATVGHVSFGWLSGLQIEGLRIDNPPGFPTERPAMTMKSLAADVSVLSLLFGTLSAEGEIVGLEVFVEQNADGTTNLQKLAREGDATTSPAEGEPKPADPEPGTGSQPSDMAFALDFQLRDCAVTIRRAGEVLEALTAFQCHAKSASDSDEIVVEAAGKLLAGDLEVLIQLDPAAQTTDAKLVTHGLDLAAWAPLIDSFMPGQLTALAGKVDGDITAKMHSGDQVELAGELVIDGPRIAGPIVQGMDLQSPRWTITPAMALGTGATKQIDASKFAVDLEWLHINGKPAGADGQVALTYDVDLARLAEFGGPIPEMLKGSGSKLTGELNVPTKELPTDAAGWAKAIAASANLAVTSLDVAGFALRDLGLDVAMTDGAVRIATAPSSKLDGGALVASIDVDLNDFAKMPTNATLKWQGGKLTGGATQALRYVVPLFSGLDADVTQILGDVNLDLNFAGPAMKAESDSWLTWLDGWSGGGQVGLANTAFAPSQELQGLLQPLGALSAKIAPIAEGGKLKIDSFAAPFSFAKGLVTTSEAKWVAAGKAIGLGGSVGFDGKVDYQLDFASLLKGHKDGEKVLAALGGTLPGAKLTGTVDAPKLGLPEVGDLATKLLEQQGKDLLEGGIKKGLEGLFGGKKK
ncbi:MAG: hypothetical protein KAI24_09190 [Planctomycetes bacterium]|nr:hypothetical protein [Planctomycetota bacterium]